MLRALQPTHALATKEYSINHNSANNLYTPLPSTPLNKLVTFDCQKETHGICAYLLYTKSIIRGYLFKTPR
jgi:hypothetical protein